MKPYDSYKKTSYDWLSEIPNHWNCVALRNITTLSDVRNKSRTNLELLSVYREYGVIKKSSRDDNHNVESVDLSNYKYVDKGYLVINKMKLWQGSLGISKHVGIVSPAYIVCKVTSESNFEYLHYLLRAPLFKTYYNRISTGIRVGQWDSSYDNIKKLHIYLPPRTEQDQIVRYLDWQISKINKLVQNKKKQIELLKEQKQAVINKAVTKGLDDSVPMKDSGVEWLGEVPEGWGFMRNKNIMIEQKDNVGINSNDYALLSLTINGVILRDMESGKGKFPKDFETYKIVEKNEMIFCLFDMDETPRTIGISNYNGMITGAYDVFKVERIKVDYLYYYYLSLDNKKALKPLYTGLRKIIGVPKFLRIKTPFPPLEEQQAIVDYITDITFKIDTVIKETEQEIELLDEYKTSLISSVVTGKVDVRDVTVPEVDTGEEITEKIENNNNKMEEH